MRIVRSQRCLAFVLAFSAGLAATAQADLPAILDRVPGDAAFVAATGRLEAGFKVWERFSEAFSALIDAPLDVNWLLITPGVNQAGAAAIILADIPADADPGNLPAVVLVPVNDAKVFITALGGKPGEGVLTLTPANDTTVYARESGPDYVLLGMSRDAVEAFDASRGQIAAHTARLGPVGGRVASSADLVIIANMEKAGPGMLEALGDGARNLAGAAAMMGGQLGGGGDVEGAASPFFRDARAGVIGLSLVRNGIALDFATQFHEDSELGRAFTVKGDAHQLFSRSPQQQYLFAVAADTSSPVVKGLLGELAPAPGADANDMISLFLAQAHKVDGMVFQVGNAPGGLAAGFLSAAAAYMKTSDPASIRNAARTAIESMNDRTEGAVTYTTSIGPDAAEVAGKKVDTWSIRETIDPQHPGAGMIQQRQMLTGAASGQRGFLGSVDDGVVMTFSQSSSLMSRALEAAAGGNGLSEMEAFKAQAALMPKGSVLLAAVDTRNLMTNLGGLVAMMTGAPMPALPAGTPPLMLGATSDSSGLHVRAILPTPILDMLRDIADVAGEMRAPAAAPQRRRGPGF